MQQFLATVFLQLLELGQASEERLGSGAALEHEIKNQQPVGAAALHFFLWTRHQR